MIFTTKFEELDSDFSSKFKELDSDFSTSFDENIVIEESRRKFFEGDYEITPTREVQVLNVAEMVMTEDLVVQPIPKEYGKVTYNQNKELIIT